MGAMRSEGSSWELISDLSIERTVTPINFYIYRRLIFTFTDLLSIYCHSDRSKCSDALNAAATVQAGTRTKSNRL